jgi:DnaJ like chaperone protein
MSIWTRIADTLSSLKLGESLAALFERLVTPPDRTVAFTIAVIALGAKMAKADGLVTRAEVAAFREVFVIPPGEEDNAARVFDLARQDVAGFEEYATRIARMFDDGHQTLVDLMEGLFHIATADGAYHPAEDDFLERVGEIFGLHDREFAALRCRFVGDCRNPDPWTVLGLPPTATLDQARAAWRSIVMDSHPDRLVARGLPEEAVRMAENRLVAVNRAWDEIRDRAA